MEENNIAVLNYTASEINERIATVYNIGQRTATLEIHVKDIEESIKNGISSDNYYTKAEVDSLINNIFATLLEKEYGE